MNREQVARELVVAAREVVALSEWDVRERNINTELLEVVASYRNLLFDMMKAGEISQSDYRRAAGDLFKATDKLRDVILRFTR